MSRQYSSDEVSAILKEAAEETRKRSKSPGKDGLTLAELQAIGAESDIDAAAISRAAARLDARTLEPAKRRLLGINIGASHAVRLQRPMTETEFAALVADCRRIFDARGKVSEQENYREWRNGNLRVWTEQDPHSGTSLLSMQSTQGLMRTMIGAGGAIFLGAIFMAVMSVFETGGDAIEMALLLSAVSIAMLGFSALGTRSWSSTREEQMEEIGERAIERQVIGQNDASPVSTGRSNVDSAAEDGEQDPAAIDAVGADSDETASLLGDMDSAQVAEQDRRSGPRRERTG